MVVPVLSDAANSTVVFRLVATTCDPSSKPIFMPLHACIARSNCLENF